MGSLKVFNGSEWVSADGNPNLPIPSIADAGKFTGVDETGKYALMAAGGGESKGVAFPEAPEVGDTFFRTDLNASFIRDAILGWRCVEAPSLTVYVSTTGDNANDGLTADSPKWKLHNAISAYGSARELHVRCSGGDCGNIDGVAVPNVFHVYGSDGASVRMVVKNSGYIGVHNISLGVASVLSSPTLELDSVSAYDLIIDGVLILWAWGSNTLISAGALGTVFKNTNFDYVSGMSFVAGNACSVPVLRLINCTASSNDPTYWADSWTFDGANVVPCLSIEHCRLTVGSPFTFNNATVGVSPSYAEVHGASNATYVNCVVNYANTLFGTVD